MIGRQSPLSATLWRRPVSNDFTFQVAVACAWNARSHAAELHFNSLCPHRKSNIHFSVIIHLFLHYPCNSHACDSIIAIFSFILIIIIITRMVQLPATAAIEYVAACWVSGAGGFFVRSAFVRGGLLSGGLMPVPPKFNAYTHRLGFLCLAS